eukprot:gene20810-32075_t
MYYIKQTVDFSVDGTGETELTFASHSAAGSIGGAVIGNVAVVLLVSKVKDGRLEEFAVQDFILYRTGEVFGSWEVVRGSVDLVGTYWQAPGNVGHSVDLDGASPGWLAQNLGSLTAGQYRLTFDLSGNPDHVGLKRVLVTVGDASQEFSYKTGLHGQGRAQMNYVGKALYFSVDGTRETVLGFASLNAASSNQGAVIGNVAVVLVAPRIVKDGRFEEVYVPAEFQLYRKGEAFGPWKVVSGSVELVGTHWHAPGNVGQSVDLDGASVGSLEQNLGCLTAGQYRLTFDFSANPDSMGWKRMQVTVGDASQEFVYTQTRLNGQGRAQMNYFEQTVDSSVDGTGETELTFASLNAAGSFWGPVIGNV